MSMEVSVMLIKVGARRAATVMVDGIRSGEVENVGKCVVGEISTSYK